MAMASGIVVAIASLTQQQPIKMELGIVVVVASLTQ
jgi:hypothetical protein